MADNSEEFLDAGPSDERAPSPTPPLSGIIHQETDSLQVPPQEEENKSQSRSTSAVGSNAVEFLINTQMNRALVLEQLLQQFKQFTNEQFTLEDVVGNIKIVDEQWKQFNKDHDKLGSTCKKSLFTHPYIKANYFNKAFFAYHEVHSILIRQHARLNELVQNQQPQQLPIQAALVHTTPRLPMLHIQQFNGEYADWPAFQDLFKSMVIHNNHLTDVEKM